MISNERLTEKAIAVLSPRNLDSYKSYAGSVGCALLDDQDNIHVGVCIVVPCGIGFCAEHSAVAAMVTSGETKIKKIVAVDRNKTVLPPCGRCREFLFLVNKANMETEVIVEQDKAVPLETLLPHHWFPIKEAS